jgi:hypothetical protein
LLFHRYFLATLYQVNAMLWRPFDQMNFALVYVVTFALIAIFVATYLLLVRPKSLRADVAFGAFIGLALGISAGFGTYIHMSIPLTIAWAWFIGGCRSRRPAGGPIPPGRATAGHERTSNRAASAQCDPARGLTPTGGDDGRIESVRGDRPRLTATALGPHNAFRPRGASTPSRKAWHSVGSLNA